MKERTIFSFLCIGLFFATLTGCDLLCQLFSKEQYELTLLEGTFSESSGDILPSSSSYTFHSDGTGSYSVSSGGLFPSSSAYDFTWNGDETNHSLAIAITYLSGNENTDNFTYSFTNCGDDLNLTSMLYGSTVTYSRLKQ